MSCFLSGTKSHRWERELTHKLCLGSHQTSAALVKQLDKVIPICWLSTLIRMKTELLKMFMPHFSHFSHSYLPELLHLLPTSLFPIPYGTHHPPCCKHSWLSPGRPELLCTNLYLCLFTSEPLSLPFIQIIRLNRTQSFPTSTRFSQGRKLTDEGWPKLSTLPGGVRKDPRNFFFLRTVSLCSKDVLTQRSPALAS